MRHGEEQRFLGVDNTIRSFHPDWLEGASFTVRTEKLVYQDGRLGYVSPTPAQNLDVSLLRATLVGSVEVEKRNDYQGMLKLDMANLVNAPITVTLKDGNSVIKSWDVVTGSNGRAEVLLTISAHEVRSSLVDVPNSYRMEITYERNNRVYQVASEVNAVTLRAIPKPVITAGGRLPGASYVFSAVYDLV